MRRYIPTTLDGWLALAIIPCLAIAWLSGYWLLGAAAALGILCALAVRNPSTLQIQAWAARCRIWDKTTARKTEAAPPVEMTAPRERSAKAQPASLVEQLVEQRRVALLLRPQVAAGLTREQLEKAQEALDDTMAIVPDGPVAIYARLHETIDPRLAKEAERIIGVDGFFLDRLAVSNREYAAFVEDGGYEQMSLWDEAIWPAVLGFLDRSGQPGPRYWQRGTFPSGQGEHPVVGVCWYEASAFARWAGKRLPTDPEWVKAGAWPVTTDGAKPAQRRFPWGDAMDRRKVNLWGSGSHGTIPVADMSAGASVNGIQQLVGNVWEWTSSSFGAWEPTKRRIETAVPLKSIRGGAFDTYFDTQAHCQFQSGEDPLARKHNIGFRCALGFCDVANLSTATEPLDESNLRSAELEEALA